MPALPFGFAKLRSEASDLNIWIRNVTLQRDLGCTFTPRGTECCGQGSCGLASRHALQRLRKRRDQPGGAAPGFSTGQAQKIIEDLAKRELPAGMSFEWTELTYQQILAGNGAGGTIREPAAVSVASGAEGRPAH